MTPTLLPRPSVRIQRLMTRGMQAILVGVVYGIVFAQPKAITNGAIALLITFAPAILERNYRMPLAQHGLDDTVRDMMFNTLGALAVATFGQAHLSGVAETVRASLLAEE